MTRFCYPVENTQFEIGDLCAFQERVTPNIRIDTIVDTLIIHYFIGNYGASVQLTLHYINGTLSLDSTQSSVNVRISDGLYDEYSFVMHKTEIVVHSFESNTCCNDPEYSYYEEDYFKMPGSFIISLDGSIQSNSIQRNFHMTIDIQMLEKVGEEC
ncbi:MAG: hypothetical protein KI791_18885 [Cyclobacteriaceae bacterium]|nr:hypothetical protein [Cyclobacteriaceae bacterium SS2]